MFRSVLRFPIQTNTLVNTRLQCRKFSVTRYNKNLPYYEQPGNKMNPHQYFYRVLAIPLLKFCTIMIGTYYSLRLLREILIQEQEEKIKEKS
ncbi:hypothetical protein DAMA08_032350 [Martiniozyma asiatica (nom. inval.)]|nr:hypothetical protein DAMA08_032350 [Martiniozyma asiatica]